MIKSGRGDFHVVRIGIPFEESDDVEVRGSRPYQRIANPGNLGLVAGGHSWRDIWDAVERIRTT